MDKTTFGVLTILFNGYGVPCFLQGKKELGIKRIIFGVVSLGIIALINAIKGIFLGIEILKMSDEEFKAKLGSFDSGIPA